MMAEADWRDLDAALDRLAASGRRAIFWLRDDDAVAPSDALDRLIALVTTNGVPLALAVIPEPAGEALADRLRTLSLVDVVQHGWVHANHAPAGQKKQEYGAHRAVETMIAEIAEGRQRLERLFGRQFFSMFVPPWNRIDPALAERLPEIGFAAMSTFAASRSSRITTLNSTVDIMDWRGAGGSRSAGELLRDIVGQLSLPAPAPVGVLAHHLVHDDDAWRFLEQLIGRTTGHTGCRWASIRELLAGA